MLLIKRKKFPAYASATRKSIETQVLGFQEAKFPVFIWELQFTQVVLLIASLIHLL